MTAESTILDKIVYVGFTAEQLKIIADLLAQTTKYPHLLQQVKVYIRQAEREG